MRRTDPKPGATRRLKRAGMGLLASALAATALAAVPVGASAAGTLTVTGSVNVPTGADAGNVYAVLLDLGGNAVAEAQVTAGSPTTSGSYEFDNVVPGSYKVYFVDPTATDDVAPQYLGQATAFQDAAPTTISSSGALGAVTLVTGGEITGTISDANTGDTGRSITADPVGATDPGQTAFWSWYADGLPLGSIATSGSTTGYAIGGLVPGSSYTLAYGFRWTATMPHWSRTAYVTSANSVTADAGLASVFKAQTATPLAVSFGVPAVGAISGTVTNPGGLPNPNVSVELFDSSGAEIPASVSWSDGTYTASGLLPGAYKVDFVPTSTALASQFYNGAVTLASASAVNVASGQTTANVSVTLAAGATVSGNVTAAQGGAALGGIEVELIDAQGHDVADAFTAADGTYTLTQVPAGSWYVKFDGGRAFNGSYYATEYYVGRSTLAGAKALAVNAGAKVTGVDQALLAEGTTAAGIPKVSAGSLSGLATNKVALKFKLTAGTGPAGYLKSFTVKLPKNVSWNKSKLGSDIVIAHDKFTYTIKSGKLVITFATGKKTVSFQIKSGGITVSKGIQNQAKQHKIKSQSVAVGVTDTAGVTSSVSFTVKNPH
jgi:hypothetical protein